MLSILSKMTLKSKWTRRDISEIGRIIWNGWIYPWSTPHEQNMEFPSTETVDPVTYSTEWLSKVWIYAVICTRPWYKLGFLSQFMLEPKTEHFTTVKYVLRYLKATTALEIQLPVGPFKLFWPSLVSFNHPDESCNYRRVHNNSPFQKHFDWWFKHFIQPLLVSDPIWTTAYSWLLLLY